jgi:hypothetical protein
VEAAKVYGFSEMLKFLAKQIFSKKKIFCEGKYRNFRNIIIVQMKNSEVIT